MSQSLFEHMYVTEILHKKSSAVPNDVFFYSRDLLSG